jgi:hypothetical protein
MNTQRSLRTRAARRNTLAACLAVALAAGGVGAADVAHFPATSRIAGAKASPPMHPSGNNLPVTNCLDDGSAGSLRQVIAGAIDGDVIDLSALTCSTITLQSGAIAVPASVSIQGPGQTKLTIDGGGTDRVFLSKYDTTISDITITNGRADGDGGCVDVVGSDLTMTRTTITECHAGHVDATQSRGGGVYVGGNLLMKASTISDSSATANENAYGGGAYVTGVVSINNNSAIQLNEALTTSGNVRGGGLFAVGYAIVTDSSVSDNEVATVDGTAFGGGIFSASVVQAVKSEVSGNTAHSETAWSQGGGVHSGSVTFLVSTTVAGNNVTAGCATCTILGGGVMALGWIVAGKSTVRDNKVMSAAGSAGVAAGGGLATFASGTGGLIQLMSSTISGNSAIGGENIGGYGYGGGIAAIFRSPFIAVHSTVAFNRASHAGGGAIGGNASDTAEPELHNTIVANNEAPIGFVADISTGKLFSDPFVISGSHNLVTSWSMSISFDETPLTGDPLLMQIANNGGLTETHALAASSPALDAGYNAENWDFVQRDCPYARMSGAAVDIGAFELQTESSDYVFRSGFDDTVADCFAALP